MVKLSDLSYNSTQTFEVETYDLDYRRDQSRSWAARIYQPRGSGPFPAILDVHGGAWNRGERTSTQVMDQVLVLLCHETYRVYPVASDWGPKSVCVTCSQNCDPVLDD